MRFLLILAAVGLFGCGKKGATHYVELTDRTGKVRVSKGPCMTYSVAFRSGRTEDVSVCSERHNGRTVLCEQYGDQCLTTTCYKYPNGSKACAKTK